MIKGTKVHSLGLLAILICLLASISMVSAHQPRLETGTNVSYQNPIVVQNPEISQAFYSQLNGNPDYYKINSDKTFKLYLNLLVPTSPGISGSFVSAEVLDSTGNSILMVNGTNTNWQPYFEEFGGDNYLKGPEATTNLPAGTYYIKVFNTQNQGKYAIAIGDIETFPLDESLKAIVTIPLLKEQFFGKPVSTLFFEFLGIILALGSIMILFAMLLKSRKSEEITNLTVKVSTVIKPVMWLGIVITVFIWLYVMYKDPLNIVGILNTLLLIILIILSWYIRSKVSRMEFGKLPLKTMTLLVVLWWVFVYLAIAII